MNSHDRIIRAIADECWAILPNKLDEICAVARLWASGADISPYAAKQGPTEQRVIDGAQAAVAVLPLFGTIARRANMITDFSGGTSVEKFRQQFRASLADPEIGSILIHIDSPGGGVFGVDELASEIFAARGKKHIVALADPVAASAAIWLGTAASEFVVTPSGEAGSIGVYAVHSDFSAQNEMVGIKQSYISAGKFKVEGNPDEPLGDEARAHIQASVDRYYQAFTGAVARNRGVKREDVVNGMGQGRMMGAKEAVKSGLADWVGTFDEVIERVLKNPGAVIGKRAEASQIEPVAFTDEELAAKEGWAREQYI